MLRKLCPDPGFDFWNFVQVVLAHIYNRKHAAVREEKLWRKPFALFGL